MHVAYQGLRNTSSSENFLYVLNEWSQSFIIDLCQGSEYVSGQYKIFIFYFPLFFTFYYFLLSFMFSDVPTFM